MTASLYIHVPFCAGACDYCDFYSEAIRPAENGKADPRMDLFVERLLASAEELTTKFRPEYVPTVYMGGGTPSILGAARMEKLLAGLRKLLSGGARGTYLPEEFTVEANPESTDEEFLAVCRAGGVSRISLGIQSFYEPSREAVHRTGSRSRVRLEECLALVSRYFPFSFSADLIAGLPFQTKAVLLDDVRRLVDFNPAHISLYALTLAEGTPLELKVRAGGRAASALPANEEADALWLAGSDYLDSAGFRQYEVSNFARPGKESLHNIRYWRMENWLALGPGASATVIDDASGTGRRYTITPDLDAWLSGRQTCAEEFLDRVTLMKESLLMGFRYAQGPDTRLFRLRFGTNITDVVPGTLEKWRKRGCLETGKFALNRKGLVVLDSFLVDAFTELENFAR